MRNLFTILSLPICLHAAIILGCSDSRADSSRMPSSSDSLKAGTRSLSTGSYQWEYLWKFGSIGETNISPVSDEKVLGWLPLVRDADISIIKNKSASEKFKLMAIGGSLASGVRDGGVFREAQLTAYPNLVANQMGVEFKQPLFSEKEANGSGYKVLTSSDGSVYQYKTVSNNLGFNARSESKEFSKSIGEYDNLSFPFFNTRYPWKTMEYYDRPVSKIDEESTDFVRYFKRIMSDEDYSNKNLTYLNFLKRQTIPDFVIYDLGMDGHLKEAIIGGYRSQLPTMSEDERGNRIEFWYLKEIAAKGSKGVVVTIPDVLEFPYFHIYSFDKLKELSPGIKLGIEKNNGKVREANSTDILLPCESVIQLFTNLDDRVLEETEVLSIDEDLNEAEPFRSVNWYNEYYVKHTAKENNFAIFDLYALYKKINAGEYVTNDGIAVDPSFPNGNFYSQDGIHPTAFGQAVIANECIASINAHYGTTIELLPTAGFLKKK